MRGLNAPARCLTVRETIAATPCHLICLQETKLQSIDATFANLIGGPRLSNFTYQAASGTKGGIMLLWDDRVFDMQDIHTGRFFISATAVVKHSNTRFQLTTVYGPTRHSAKPAFLRQLRTMTPDDTTPWLIMGDFNLIYSARDKNNSNLNRSLMRRFRSALNYCGLKEIHLQNRRFTWSNARHQPTLTRIDRVFCNASWDVKFDDHVLHALSSSHSDHCPLLLAHHSGPRKPTPLRFENFWTRLPGFYETVDKEWSKPTTHTEPFHRLGYKLHNTARALRSWSRAHVSDARLKLHMAQEVILRLDEAEEARTLTAQERDIRSKLKTRLLGWAIVEKMRRKQSSRITYLREGDANTKFFHLKANGRRRRNFIQRLKTGNNWAVTHSQKQQIVQEHFGNVMSTPPTRTRTLNWDKLHFPAVDLTGIDNPFSDKEIQNAIAALPKDKAPGPDGFTGLFFKSCWHIIKGDVVAAVNAFHAGRCNDLNLLNTAAIVLVPKKDGAETISDFRPISLIHAIAKIITKVLATRLQPYMDKLISPSQSAFIKGRSIHDNFLYVRNMARRFHRNRTPTLLMKLDISKAFDSVRWDYLLELLQHRGFPARWRNWITALMATSTSKVLLNGIPTDKIVHGRGLRQGDPLSPFLFILAIDPLYQLMQMATGMGLLKTLGGRTPRTSISMYADDAAIFIKPTKDDVANITKLLHSFGEATGLRTNLEKTIVAPISCNNIDLDEILSEWPITRTGFPLKYLGLPLAIRRLRKVDFQPLIDKAAKKLSGWQNRNITQAGRICLAKTVLSAQPLYLLTVLKPPTEVLEEIDKIRKRFIWAGDNLLTGGKCKVNWIKTCSPKENGGLGVLNLHYFARALRLRWLWHEWASPGKTWIGLNIPCDDSDRRLFEACTTLTVGNGRKTSFWHSAWGGGTCPKHIAPNIYNISRGKHKTLAEATHNNKWVTDINIHAGITTQHLSEFILLWRLLTTVTLQAQQEDTICWKFTKNGQYSAASAYKAQFVGSTCAPQSTTIWKCWAPPKCKFFAWLVLQDRVWTADRLSRRGWPHSPNCPLCRVQQETAHHLLVQCRYTKRIWQLIATWASQPSLHPSNWPPSDNALEWWLNMTTRAEAPRQGTCSMGLLVIWEIWKERNRRIFSHQEMAAPSLLALIKAEADTWIIAGARALALLLSRE